MGEQKRILFISSEIFPYLPESDISLIGRYLPQGIQEGGYEIRSFMPRFGCIKERRNQLHEVIRLSGMNIIINDIDHPLIIKVSSISSARMQVYFIDNEDYFYRKEIDIDDDGNFFKDNDERALFFAKGVLETVKKLRWKPDVIHCHGWISHFLPLFLKKGYNDDPIFSESKVVVSLYNDALNQQFNPELKNKLVSLSIKSKDFELLSVPNGINLAKLAIQYSDGVIAANENTSNELINFATSKNIPVLPYINRGESMEYIKQYREFYDQILGIK